MVLCCVSEDKAGVLYNEFCIHVNEMVKSTKGSVFLTVFIKSVVMSEEQRGDDYTCKWITSFRKLTMLLM